MALTNESVDLLTLVDPKLARTPSSKQPSTERLGDRKCGKCLKNECGRTTSWISCARCGTPSHWACVARNLLDPVDIVDQWYCAPCTKLNPDLKPTYKNPPRKSNRSTSRVNYANPDLLNAPDPDRFVNMAQNRRNIVDGFSTSACQSIPLFPQPFRRVKGEELTMSWLVEDESAMTEPILVEDDEALRTLGMKMPSPTITIRQISDIVGPDTPVEVIDVASQSELSRWTLDQWASYYEDPKRDKVRNVISLEVSETVLGNDIQLPRIVREMDWVETIWPQRVVGSKAYPKVQKYCLMSVARCWTDWHIDFAGSSVFYHVLRGSKTFYFIRPTPSNLEKYEEWSGDSELQESTWLGDQVDVVYKVSLQAGHTMIIPTGWIHAVYTPVDTLVFGGNYLHSLNIPIQIRVHEIENNTKVPKKFRFPFFIRMLWYVARHYQQRLETIQNHPQKCPTDVHESTAANINIDSLHSIPPRILSGLLALSDFLISQVDSMEIPSQNITSEPKKLLNDSVDWDLIPDPKALASSLRELVISALSLAESQIPSQQATVSFSSKARRPGLNAKSVAENPSKPFISPSPFHIKIKRKASNDTSNNSHDSSSGKSKSDSTKRKPTSQSIERPPKQSKTKQALPSISQASNPSLSNKKDAAVIIQKLNSPATTEITRALRVRPTIDGTGQLVENPAEKLQPSEVEVRTTTAETRVVRQSTDESGRALYETRTVRTVIEKVFFPSDEAN